MTSSVQGNFLPKNVKPLHYSIVLEPEFTSFTFHGTVDIDVDILDDTSSISLNTKEIDIHSTTLATDGAKIDCSPQLSHNKASEITTMALGTDLKAGQRITLSHSFTGKLNDTLAGLYRSSWKDKDGKEHWLATTHMEATDARQAFPCFDEPIFKATFDITLIADDDMTCLSNMDVAKETQVDSELVHRKRKAVTFNTTPLMSTYLIACVVGELQFFESNKFRLPVRTYCTPDHDIKRVVYSANLAADTLAFYEKEFNIQYPLPKLDMLAAPDFSAGAMENFGLCIYRDFCIFLDEQNCSAREKRIVTEVVAHELSHQWFGNLVTMSSWEGLWLKEGFATWMALYACNAFYPEWKVWDGIVSNDLHAALNLDSLRSSHPIEVPVRNAAEINQIFDEISYMKGSVVINMLSKYMGEDVFMRGIRLYLEKHAYKNTVTDDLWAALSEASGKDITSFAAIWTRHVGHPVITVTEDAANGTITLKQNRFLQTADVKPEEDQILYPLVLGIRTSKTDIDKDQVLTAREGTFKIPNMDFYKLNANHIGVYRTSYPASRLIKLSQDARNGLLSVPDRAGMIADAGSLARAGYQRTSDLLALLQGFDTEPEFEVWAEIDAQIRSIRSAWLFEDQESQNALKAFHLAVVAKRAHEVGWDFKPDDSHVEQQFKATLFSAACSADDEVAVAAAKEMFRRFIAGDREAIHSNVRRFVYSTVLRLGGEEEYEALRKEYESAVITGERNAALVNLGASRDPALIQKTLAYALGPQVRTQNLVTSIAGLSGHADGIQAMWAWLQANWGELTRRLPPSQGDIGSILSLSAGRFTSETLRREAEAFLATKDTSEFELELAQVMDEIRVKEGWLGRDKKDVEDYLRKAGYYKS